MHDFFKKLRFVQTLTDQTPWVELEYVDPSSLDSFVAFINGLDNVCRLNEYRQPLFFRGQADARWTLKPKIARILDGMSLKEGLECEFEAVHYFRERAHLFAPALVPEKPAIPEWLCLMQHFSAPTRMLDWTTSFCVALYFAVSEEPLNAPGAVWFFPVGPLQKWMDAKYPDSQLPPDHQEIFATCNRFVQFGLYEARAKVDRYDTVRKSERVTAQRGVFTYCEQLFVDQATVIGQTLWECTDQKDFDKLVKIIISAEAKRFFRQYLSKLNVTAATLFPGIDGLGRSIAEILRIHRETPWVTESQT